jgi:hypothetical protein
VLRAPKDDAAQDVAAVGIGAEPVHIVLVAQQATQCPIPPERRGTEPSHGVRHLGAAALSPLVGRDEELGLLMRRWQRAKEGDGQIVLISGGAGIGKSRMTVALMEEMAGEHGIRIRYFCSPHHSDSALYPFVARIRAHRRFHRGGYRRGEA